VTKSLFRVIAVAGLTAVAGALLGAPANATTGPARDITPPSVTIEPFVRFVAGTTVATSYDARGSIDNFDVNMVADWTVSDASGICSQQLTEQSYDTLGGDPDPILGSDTVTTSIGRGVRSHPFVEDAQNYWRIPHRFVVRVTDCAGNTAVSGISTTSINVDEDNSRVVTYTGTWATGHFAGFSGGTTHFTSVAGATATFHVGAGAVAIAMEQAANRGSATVKVDGVLQQTVNSNSITKQHRRVVWQTLLGPGDHTVQVVNDATAGHPRIDFDVILD